MILGPSNTNNGLGITGVKDLSQIVDLRDPAYEYLLDGFICTPCALQPLNAEGFIAVYQ
jgi:hypothetical protein